MGNNGMVVGMDAPIIGQAKMDGVPIEHRSGPGFMVVAMCREDKDQMNRVEEKLDRLLKEMSDETGAAREL